MGNVKMPKTVFHHEDTIEIQIALSPIFTNAWNIMHLLKNVLGSADTVCKRSAYKIS